MIAIRTPNAIDLAKLYDHATMQGRLIQDVRVAVFEFMLRKKRNSIAGAGYSQDIVKMGVARYTEADGTHEVTISNSDKASQKHADKASKNRGTVPSEMGVVPSETERPADISEPLVLLALSHHFDTWSPGLYTMHHFGGQRIPGDGNKFNGWENYIAIAVLRAFSGDESPELSRFLRFHTKGCDVDALKKKRARVVGVFRASGLDLAGEFTDNTRPGHDARRESETRRSRRTWCNIGEETKSPTETLRWFDNPTSTVCYPDTSLGPDLAFRLLLDGNELVWLLIQCKYHVHGGSNSKGDNLVSKSELTKDAVRKVTPNCFYKTKPESREPSTALAEAVEGRNKYQKKYYNSQRALKRSRTKVNGLEDELDETKRRLSLVTQEKDAEVQQLESKTFSLEEGLAQSKENNAGYQKEIHTLKARSGRVAGRIETAEKRALALFGEQVREANGDEPFKLKVKGVIPDATRNVLSDLIALHGVPATRAIGALKCIAQAMGRRVEGNVSERSLGRITLEGGAASMGQFVEAVHEAEGVTISSDGTTHKNINLESRHATVLDKEGRKHEFFLNVAMAVNHTSETQLNGWTDLVEDIYDIGRELFGYGSDGAREWREFWNKLTGMMSDHAEDQKKLFRLLKAFKERIEREKRGERWVHETLGANGLLVCLTSISQGLVQDAGGIAAWEALTADVRSARYADARRHFFHEVGEAAFDVLPAEAKVDVDFMIWAGCCMHKDMNAFKGFCTGMEGWWKENGKDGPMKLYNRDNAATIRTSSGTDAAKRAAAHSKGGAIKLVSLAGAIFRHKDRKRGQQDTLRFFFHSKLGFIIAFPDTSNTRFQSHATACEVVLTYLDLLIEFLKYVRDNKGSESFNNLEKNVFDALQCHKTIREVVLVVLYSQAISAPYMREIRGRFRSYDSVLEQGPLHAKVIAHLEALAANPSILIDETVEYKMAALDSKPWHTPDAIYAASAWIQQCDQQERAEMKSQLAAACKSAAATWRRFSTEFEEVRKASKKNLRRAPMSNTNDSNERIFAHTRRTFRNVPSMTTQQLSARETYRCNGTSLYLAGMSSDQRARLRGIARERNESGANQAARDAQTQYLMKTAAETSRKRVAREEKRQRALDKIESTKVMESLVELDRVCALGPRDEGYLTVAQLDEQLNWYQHKYPDGPLPTTKKARGDRARKIEYLRAAITYHTDQQAAMDVDMVGEGSGEVLDSEIWSLDSDLDDVSDSEAEFYGQH
ncbi:hypothetical protein K523DRAFT_413413 [Schizophyllum commune Tattone D]|nr:hypothetical protein K523DRAFT_413413 [Schizophyllum commune Tattone D]